jgi:hypothetical protein
LKNTDLKNARSLFLKFIQETGVVGSLRNRVTVVFDAEKSLSSTTSNFYHSYKFNPQIKVIFTQDKTADELIIEILKSSSNPKNIVVVSDDNQLRFASRLYRAQLMNVKLFLEKANKFKIKVKKIDDEKLSISQQRQINKELERIWLKKY